MRPSLTAVYIRDKPPEDYLAEQLQRLLDAHHQQIKAVQLLQQDHAGGRQAHLDLLANAPRLEGGRQLLQYPGGHRVDEVVAADAARALTWLRRNKERECGLQWQWQVSGTKARKNLQ